jgi:tripartite-type tricarboxylate transporter receptor subunit TctC
VASSKVSKPVLECWHTELVKVLKTPELAKELDAHGLIPQPGTREELAQEIARESATWARVIRERKITNQ